MNKIIPILVLTSVASLAGCETFDAFTGEEKVSSTTKGAGIGAGIGAVLAYVQNRDESSKKRKQSMLKAAGIGAIAGGSVGYYMDTQEAKLRKTLRESGVSVERDGDNINLVMPGNITFVTAGHDLNQDFHQVLGSVVLVLQEFEKTTIVVVGHTDSRGAESYNQALSKRRADTVAGYLRQKGIAEARIDATGFGERNPIGDNATSEGQALNRRVELSLLPITE